MTPKVMRGEEGSAITPPLQHPAICGDSAPWDLSAPKRERKLHPAMACNRHEQFDVRPDMSSALGDLDQNREWWRGVVDGLASP